MKIYLVRHAQSRPTRGLEESQWPLSDVGRAQAEELVPILKELEISRFYSSPYVRCADTIGPFIQSTGTPLHYVDALREHKIANGLLEDFQEIWDRYWSDFEFCLPGCETSDSAQRRMHEAVLNICQSASADTIGISSHGNVIGLLLNIFDPSFSGPETQALRNPDVIRLRYEQNILKLDKTFKSTPSLDRIAKEFKVMENSRE